MTVGRARATALIARWIVRASARLVPFRFRAERLSEWEAEMWMLEQRGAGPRRVQSFALGVIVDALAERRVEEGMMEGWAQDLRRAWRRIVRDPAFAAVTVVILALGIGANTVLFSALNAALLETPPYPDADRLVMVDLMLASNAEAAQEPISWSYPKFRVLRDEMSGVEALVGFSPSSAALTGLGDASRVGIEYVSPGYFELLGVRTPLGRAFTADEVPPDAGAVAIVSHALWSTRMGADPSAVGRTFSLDDQTFQTVGVAPEGFRGLTGAADLWVPMAGAATIRGASRLERPWAYWLQVIGRLRTDVSLEQSNLQAERVGAKVTELYPDPSGGGEHGVEVVGFLTARVNPIARLAVAAVWGAGVLLLLVACGNVASLFVARASARESDVAVRAALGAGRARLIGDHLLESVLLAAMGGALGLLLAMIGSDIVPRAISYALETSGTRSLQYLATDAIAVDASVLAWGFALALLGGLAFGFLPARYAAKADVARALRAGGAGNTGARGRVGLGRARSVLVAAQLALTIVLLAGAGLMVESSRGLADVSLGFTHRNVMAISYDRGPGSSADENLAFETELLQRISALPGVLDVAVVPCAPLYGRCEVAGIRRVDDGPEIEYGDMEGILSYQISDDYFSTIGAAVLSGRTFMPADAPGAAPMAIINETAQRRLFRRDALGHRISVTNELTAAQMATVVGVVADVRYGSLEEAIGPAVYFSARQDPRGYGTLLVRGSVPPLALASPVREIVSELSPDLPLTHLTTLAETVSAANARTRVVLWLLVAFAVSGLVLSGLGLYALVSYSVVRRTREVGVRMALGAGRPRVLTLVASGPVLVVVVGTAAGVVMALLLTGFLESLLFQVEPGDPLVLALSTGLLASVACVAAFLPARRATRVDPSVALRGD